MMPPRDELRGAVHIDAPTITETAAALRRGETTAVRLTDACLQRIAQWDRSINAFIAVLGDEARVQAAAADRELAAGHDRGPLHGIPVSLKDIFDVKGTATTAGSQVRSEHIAIDDALVVARLRQAGAVVIGKTNLHEFALGTTNEESAFGPVHHPLDDTRSPGGSSGGSAASVLAGMAHASIGTDTGGSVRIPAAACGLVGLKPSFGDIATAGAVPLSTTLDHVGPLCRSVEDARLLFEVLRADAGANVSAGALLTVDASSHEGQLRGRRFGVLTEYFTSMLDARIAKRFDEVCTLLTAAGASLEEVVLPHAADIGPVYTHIALAEGAAYHASTLDSHPESYTPGVRLRLEMGRYILAEDYVRALRGRDVLTHEVNALLHGRDALLLPTLPIGAPRLGATTVRIGGSDEPVRNVMLRLTQLFNITGHPALTLPCGVTSERLPIGLQVVGARGRTAELLGIAAAVEAQVGPGKFG
jgi:aspartyl-tRNA(Asn)/glutamyl-tRNA(Gln) amidotransferase subunit A